MKESPVAEAIATHLTQAAAHIAFSVRNESELLDLINIASKALREIACDAFTSKQRALRNQL